MSSYTLHPIQEGQVADLIRSHAATIAEKVARAIKETSQHGRGSVIGLTLKVAFDKEKPQYINIEVQEKIKHPKSPNADMTSWSDPFVELAFDTSEDHGQQRIIQ